MKGKVILLCSLCVLLLLVVFYVRDFNSSETTTEGGEEASEALFGEFELNKLAISVNDVRTEVRSEGEDEQRVIVDITVDNQSEQVKNISLVHFTLVDEDGYAYSHTSDASLKGILGGQLHPNRKNRGEVAFDVPVSTQYELVFTDHTKTGQLVWPLPLETDEVN
ncbi:DUF4352 domain-containing protein [Alkalihalobacillus pseudalcaliphilus]|uniref:DUF4352 domain-containing protein n=1 Tax=Alkalihalobacillus pseudalcaliphilus TaxID=79884 RepID=UPI00064D7ECD|nr:DUF4352 domain-containing protein [Alkalihalobacillus pseudalcaliphilus]KMK76571.1 hypothetical protein AB990_15500 [Alkalihalobacillus pseudalcaliphilus]